MAEPSRNGSLALGKEPQAHQGLLEASTQGASGQTRLLLAQFDNPIEDEGSEPLGGVIEASSTPLGSLSPGEWSTRMESSIWSVLQASSGQFSTIELVECNRPKCEVHFTGVEYRQAEQGLGSWGGAFSEILQGFGKDEHGAPIIRQANIGFREKFPGTWVIVLQLSTESAD